MLKYIVYIAFIVIAQSLFAEDKLVLCTTFPVYNFAKNIVQGHNSIKLDLFIAPDVGCPHDYVLTPQDRKKLDGADCLIINGSGMEEFMEDIIKEKKFFLIDTSFGITNVIYYNDKDDASEACAEQHHHTHTHKEVNPHFFVSPIMAQVIVENIANGLTKFDPEGSTIYRKNAENYKAKLRQIEAQMKDVSKKLKNKKIITQHNAFDYFAKDMGLEVIATIYTHHQKELSAAELNKIIKLIRNEKPAAIFTEPQYSDKTARVLSSQTGVQLATLDPVASGETNAPLDYYERVMLNNLNVIAKVCGLTE